MANRKNHYEAAFEAYLRDAQIPYVAVDEARRSLLADGRSLKSLDFIVSSDRGITWLVDVKGRRFPSGRSGKQYWKNWSTEDDMKSLAQWEDLFGKDFVGLYVFAYEVVGERSPLPQEQIFAYRDSLYAFVAMTLAEYRRAARPISTRWETVAVGATDFRRLARGADEYFRWTESDSRDPAFMGSFPDDLLEL